MALNGGYNGIISVCNLIAFVCNWTTAVYNLILSVRITWILEWDFEGIKWIQIWIFYVLNTIFPIDLMLYFIFDL